MSTILVKPTYALPELDSDDRLQSVLKATLKAKDLTLTPQNEPGLIHWDAEYFGLHKSSLFSQLSEEKKNKILEAASSALLREAYFIEKSGMSFTAKMALLANSTQERMLYSLFAADETIHLSHIQQHLGYAPSETDRDAFISLLSRIIQEANRESLVVLIQVVLEGWGITHYHGLAENCKTPDLQNSLKMIIKDEARHHGSGMVLAKAQELSVESRDYLLSTLEHFLAMVRCGPQTLVACIEKITGKLEIPQKYILFSELHCENDTQGKLNLIRSLLIQAGQESLSNELEKRAAFKAMSAEECASIA